MNQASGSTDSLQLRDQDLGDLFQFADQQANKAQTRFMRTVRLHVVALVGASLAQAFASLHEQISQKLPIFMQTGLVVESWEQVWYRFLAFFVILILLSRFWMRCRPHHQWINYRAAAERAKQLAWFYALGVSAQGKVLADEAEAERQLLAELNTSQAKVAASESLPNAISPAMRQLRAATIQQRVQVYVDNRLAEQVAWYKRKARWNRGRLLLCQCILYLVEVVALVAALLLAFKVLDTSKWTGLMYPCLSIAAGMVAWLGHKRYKEVATAYAATQKELQDLLDKAPGLQTAADEAAFAQWVQQSEDAMAREHEIWHKRRGG
jgi:hypothetical protein